MLTLFPALGAHFSSLETLGEAGGSRMSLCRWSRGTQSQFPSMLPCGISLLVTSLWALSGPNIGS